MDKHLFIALVGGLVNAGLSTAVPCLINKNDNSFFGEMRKVYANNKQTILTSSIVIVITIYIALKLAPTIKPIISNLAALGRDSYEPAPVFVNTGMIPLRNLASL